MPFFISENWAVDLLSRWHFVREQNSSTLDLVSLRERPVMQSSISSSDTNRISWLIRSNCSSLNVSLCFLRSYRRFQVCMSVVMRSASSVKYSIPVTFFQNVGCNERGSGFVVNIQ